MIDLREPEAAIADPAAAPETVHEQVIEAHATFEPKRTICLPVDESEGARQAVQWAIEKVINPETDQVILLNVRNYVSADYSMDVVSYVPFIFPEGTF